MSQNESLIHGVMSYLREHTIDDEAIIKEYQLGYVADPLPGDERFRSSLAIPYLTRRGVRNIKFRKFTGDIKFDSPAGIKPRLYNTNACFYAGEYIGLTEGEVDAIAATENLRIPSMGIPGAEMWRNQVEIWKPIFKDFTRVYLFADGDEAGDRLAHAVSESLGWRIRVIRCPEGEDVSSMIKMERSSELTQMIEDVNNGY